MADERISPPTDLSEMLPAEIALVRDVNMGVLVDAQIVRHCERSCGGAGSPALDTCQAPPCNAAAWLMELGLVGVEDAGG